jgi:hypothetical protein
MNEGSTGPCNQCPWTAFPKPQRHSFGKSAPLLQPRRAAVAPRIPNHPLCSASLIGCRPHHDLRQRSSVRDAAPIRSGSVSHPTIRHGHGRGCGHACHVVILARETVALVATSLPKYPRSVILVPEAGVSGNAIVVAHEAALAPPCALPWRKSPARAFSSSATWCFICSASTETLGSVTAPPDWRQADGRGPKNRVGYP